MKFYAHSGGDGGDKSDWQELKAHLQAVAALAAEMAKALGLEKAGRLAGLFHDLGKYTAAFQKRLEGGPSVDHSTAGAWHILQTATDGDRFMAELIARGSVDRNDFPDDDIPKPVGRSPRGSVDRNMT